LGGRGSWISEFEDSLVYKVSFRTARAIQKNLACLKKKKKKKKKKEKRKRKKNLSNNNKNKNQQNKSTQQQLKTTK
jgi:hypothetical protein